MRPPNFFFNLEKKEERFIFLCICYNLIFFKKRKDCNLKACGEDFLRKKKDIFLQTHMDLRSKGRGPAPLKIRGVVTEML